MSPTIRLFVVAWILAQAVSMLMLRLGSRWTDRPLLRRLGEVSHRQKLQALDRVWPLTRLRGAIERRDTRSCTLILASLIALKSLGCFLLGLLMVFWLPIASLLVPAIVTAHDANDESLRRWAHRVATLQVTSHTIAAAMGFAVLTLEAFKTGAVIDALAAHLPLVAVAGLASLGFAIAAGRFEATGVIERGI